MADLHDSTEHYLATIFEIEEEGIEIKRARIAERLRISAPSVTEHIQRMEKLGLVKVDESNSVSLTSEGRNKASSVIRRHRLAERLLVDVIGLDWALAHEEADRWEHVISDAVEEKLITLLNNPDTCPHGNPIPNTDGSLREVTITSQSKMVALSTLDSGSVATIRRIGERIETDLEWLSFVADHKLIPGEEISVLKTSADDVVIGSKTNSELIIQNDIAKSVFVEVN